MNEKGRQTKLLAAVAIIAMVVCAFAVILPSDNVAAVDIPEDATEIDSAQELIDAGTKGGTYVLTQNITLGSSQFVPITAETFVLYLDGHNITSNYTEGTIFDIDPASDPATTPEVTIYGSGTLSNSKTINYGNAYSLIDIGNATLTLDGNITIDAAQYGVYAQTGSNVTCNSATITAVYSAISGNGLENGASIWIKDGTYTSTGTSAIYFPSTETLDIDGGSFTGVMGIEVRAGTVTIDSATITATGSLNTAKEGTSGPLSYGMAVAVIDNQYYGDTIGVTIGNDVVLNGATGSYDVYVGDVNGANANKLEGVFDTSTIGTTYTSQDSITLNMPGYSFTTTKNNQSYRFAANDVTATSFTVPAGYVFGGTVSYTTTGTSSVTIEDAKAGSGGLTFRAGSVEISGNVVSGFGTAEEVAAKITSASGDVVLSNLTITSGKLEISANVAVDGNVIVGENASIDVASGSKLTVNQNAVLSVAGTITDTSSVENNGTIALTSTKASIPDSISGTGTVDNSAIASEGTLSGSYDTNTTFTQNQIITATDDIILVNGTVFIFEGTLIIPEGVTLTIEDGAQLVVNSSTGSLINNGTIVVESQGTTSVAAGYAEHVGGLAVEGTSSLVNNGTIILDFLPTENNDTPEEVQFNVVSGTVTNNGTIDVGEDSEMAIAAAGTVNNSADANINMNGYYTGSIRNSGTITIDGETSTNATNIIYMVASGATVDIQNLVGNIRVTDDGLTDGKNITVTGDNVNDFRVASGALSGYTSDGTNEVISGVLITSEIVAEDRNNDRQVEYYNNMIVSGTVSADWVDSTADGATENGYEGTIRADGPRIIVSGELNLSEKVSFTVLSYLTVSGTVNVAEDAVLTGGTITVTTGTIVAEEDPITGSTVNAASYSVRTTNPSSITYYYTTFANALASGATSISITGQMTIDTELTIGNGVTVTKSDGVNTVSAGANIITIADEGRINVAAGGRLNSSAAIDVQGSLYAEDKRTGLRGSSYIFSEVTSEGETDILYTNLVDALANSSSGDVISLSGDADIDANVAIPAGVTLETEGHTVDVQNDIVFTIDGTLYINSTTGGLTIAEVPAASAEYSERGEVELNGIIQSDVPFPEYADNGNYPAGAYYSIITGGKITYYIEPLENAVADINTYVDSTIQIYGDITVGDISVTGTSDVPAIVIVNDALTAGTVTIDNAELQVVPNAVVDATVANTVGSIDMVLAGGNLSNNENMSIVSATDSDGETEMVVSGRISNSVGNDLKYTFVVSNVVCFYGATVPGMTVDGTANISGGVSSTVYTSVNGDLTINGTVNVENNAGLRVTNGDTTVLGTLNVTPATSEGRGTASVGSVFIGAELTDDGFSIGTPGTVTGPLSYTTAYVSADSEVPEGFQGTGIYSTEFYVEGSLWITVYGPSTGTMVYDPALTDARFEGWMEEDETEPSIPDTANNYVIVNLNQHDALYASVDYQIYNVVVYTDGGIASVAIDGNILMGSGNSFFTGTIDGYSYGPQITAGEHRLTYTLNSGFQGEATMTIGGQAISGNMFTVSGDYNGTYTVTINLSGTEPADQTIVVDSGNGGDDMSLTDILLIVLVILIVVMAIIVALRLMRS